MIFADYLSRNVNPESSKVPTIPGLNLEVSSLELNASPSKLEHTRQESECDPQMQMLIEFDKTYLLMVDLFSHYPVVR